MQFLYVFVGIIALCVILLTLTNVLTKLNFGRSAYRTYPVADYFYGHYQAKYPRVRHTFLSQKNRLVGYVYGGENTRGLLVFAHGIHAGHESYIQEILWMVDHGWRVFAYDATGSCESEGKGNVGLVQSALDLHAALTYVESQSEFDGLPICLMGHSWGGYAVTAGLYFDHDVKACASLAGYSDPFDMMYRFAKVAISKAIVLLKPFMRLNNRILFKKYANLTAVDGINRSNIPVLIIHGKADELVRYDTTAIISKRDQITNPRVVYKTMDADGQDAHVSIFYDESNAAYIRQVNEELKELERNGRLPDQERAAFYREKDLDLFNRPNEQLLLEINGFFEENIKNKNQ